ncbi:MAG: glycosyltransferase [Limisphaerales bacterium]
MALKTLESPCFSVVTVCLDAGAALAETASGVMAQTFPGFEYVIKDGGSSDGSVERLRTDARLRVIRQPDGGIYDAMNQALAACRGRYVVFMNAGDRFHADTVLAEVAARAEAEHWPEFVYTHSWNCRDRTTMRYPPVLSRRFLYLRSLHHQATFADRECLRRLGGFDAARFRIFADHDLLVRAVVGQGARAVLCPVIGCDYEGAGFSTLAVNRRRLAAERKAIQKANFTRRERWVWDFGRALTLPGLRVALFRHGGERWKRIYLRLVSVVRGVDDRGSNQHQTKKDDE